MNYLNHNLEMKCYYLPWIDTHRSIMSWTFENEIPRPTLFDSIRVSHQDRNFQGISLHHSTTEWLPSFSEPERVISPAIYLIQWYSEDLENYERFRDSCHDNHHSSKPSYNLRVGLRVARTQFSSFKLPLKFRNFTQQRDSSISRESLRILSRELLFKSHSRTSQKLRMSFEVITLQLIDHSQHNEEIS
jgi:hypothetical protein